MSGMEGTSKIYMSQIVEPILDEYCVIGEHYYKVIKEHYQDQDQDQDHDELQYHEQLEKHCSPAASPALDAFLSGPTNMSLILTLV